MRKHSSFSVVLLGSILFGSCSLIVNVLKIESVAISQFTLKLLLILTTLGVAKFLGMSRLEIVGARGFNWRQIKKFFWLSLLLGAISSSFILVLKIPVIPLMKGLGFFQIVLLVWFWSSISEEIFARGLLQTAVKSDKKVAVFNSNISVSILTSALVFSLIHFSIYIYGGSIITTVITMMFTFLLGMLAGLSKEHGNLMSAISVHMIFNVGGVAGGIVVNVISMILSGSPIPRS